jgi:hypothetical protein
VTLGSAAERESTTMRGRQVMRTGSTRPLALDWRRAVGGFLVAALVIPVMVLAPNSRAQAEQIQLSAYMH